MSSLSSSTFDTSSIDSNKLKIQIIAYDSYQCSPTPLDKHQFTVNNKIISNDLEFPHVPIIRIFGRVQTGHTCLLHIHNIFPYIYIKYPWPAPTNESEVTRCILSLKKEIELRISQSFQRDSSEPKHGDKDHNKTPHSERWKESHQYLADISVVKGIPFYNYHVGYQPFIKISLLSGRYTTRLTKLLDEGRIYGHHIQSYESHIKHIFQFLLDYGCYSCNWISLHHFYWRSPLIQLENREDYQLFFDTNFCEFNRSKITSDLQKFISAYTLSQNSQSINILDSDEFPRMGRTLLELDTSASWIDNRTSISERPIHTDIEESANSGKRYINSTRLLLKDVEFQRRQRNLADDPKLKLFDDINRDFESEQWVEIDELKSIFNYCCENSRKEFDTACGGHQLPDKHNVMTLHSWLEHYPTCFDSVDLLQYHPVISSAYLLQISEAKKSLKTKLLGPFLSLKSQKHSPTLSQESQKILNSIDSDDEDIEFENVDEVKKENTGNNEQDDAKFLGSVPHLEIENCKEINQDRIETAKGKKKPLSFHLSEESNDEIKNNVSEKTATTDLKMLESTQAFHQFELHTEQETLPCSQLLIEPSHDFNLLPVLDDIQHSERIFIINPNVPRFKSKNEFLESLEKDYQMLKVNYPDPFYSNRGNYDSEPFYFAGEKYHLKCLDMKGLKKYHSFLSSSQKTNFIESTQFQSVWSFVMKPPNFKSVKQWVTSQKGNNIKEAAPSISMGKSDHSYGLSEPIKHRKTNFSKLISLMVEIHVNTRDNLFPDPAKDAIQAIFWHFDKCNNEYPLDIPDTGIFMIRNEEINTCNQLIGFPIRYFEDEEALIAGLVGLVELIDPDILAGYEVHSTSWGYLIDRCDREYGIDLPARLSRVVKKQANKNGDRWGYTHASAFKITGRHMLNIWRILRREVRLGNYSLENVVYHVLHLRIPHFDHKLLTKWYQDNNLISSLLRYYTERLLFETQIVAKLETIEKITEQSRLLGIDFYSIISRGSQYKVESLLVRIAKSEDYILISPSKKQVFNMDPLGCIPLVLEPESGLYKSPLVVLDFQSLYPSLITAYNYCFSTLVGRLRGFDSTKFQKIGVAEQKLPKGMLAILKSYITISPNGMMFIKPNLRKSLIAKMLTEILDARILIKGTMRKLHNDKELGKLYNNRQLALKMIANVTYGYTSATFSGRMPNSALADSIVSSGRETLLRAASEIESNPTWGAKVVYGDTDSLFVYLPGKTKEDAFRIGKEMANHITHINPAPIKLKFEKVYHPCILVSKKRYMGWMYEFEDQKKPTFDAKGIETVRRDGIPAQQKIVKKAITILFSTMDISKIKDYVTNQFTKIMNNDVNLRDFMFAKEVRLGTYKNKAYIPPGAKVSMRKVASDKWSEPQYRERVFYVVKRGFHNEKLGDRCVSPLEFINDPNSELDSEYYIMKVLIPPLERIFNLVGVDIKKWYKEMPKVLHYNIPKNVPLKKINVKIRTCLSCGCSINSITSKANICDNCIKNKGRTTVKLVDRLKSAQRHLQDVNIICDGCSKRIAGDKFTCGIACTSEDCPVYYERIKAARETESLRQKLKFLSNW